MPIRVSREDEQLSEGTHTNRDDRSGDKGFEQGKTGSGLHDSARVQRLIQPRQSAGSRNYQVIQPTASPRPRLVAQELPCDREIDLAENADASLLGRIRKDDLKTGAAEW